MDIATFWDYQITLKLQSTFLRGPSMGCRFFYRDFNIDCYP